VIAVSPLVGIYEDLYRLLVQEAEALCFLLMVASLAIISHQEGSD
jgi:tRNA-dihydrouridine synthase